MQCYPYNLVWSLGGSTVSPPVYQYVAGRDRIDLVDSANFNAAGFTQFVFNNCATLQANGYPYTVLPVPWSLSDNTIPETGITNLVRQWNQTNAYPKLVICSTHDIYTALTNNLNICGVVPQYSGDITEYWTDGTGSGSGPVGLYRHGKENIVQAETLWSMLRRQDAFPASDFYNAWRWCHLSIEHTWGYMIPTEPPGAAQAQTEGTKGSYFTNAYTSSQALIAESVQPVVNTNSTSIAVLNTLSWSRTDLVTITNTGNCVLDDQGNVVPSQRLSTGELVFMASNVPALGSRLYTVVAGPAYATPASSVHAVAGFGGTFMGTSSAPAGASVSGNALDNGLVKVRLNPSTGDIASLINNGNEFVNSHSSYGMNSYRYLLGANAPSTATGTTGVSIAVKENGPLVASLLVTSAADGCNSLTREIRIVAGQPQVEILNTLDKIATTVKEGVHFGFAFNLPANATTRMDIPWGVMNPVTDQLPGANKNWLAFQRWIDVSGDNAGVTWVGIEASMVEFGTITANLLGDTPTFATQLGDTRTVISWALNNHWSGNFWLEQGGIIPFHYAILPHGAYDPVTANRFGLEQNRPLVAVPTTANPVTNPFVAVDNPRVFVSTLKPAEDGSGALILRLRSLSSQTETVNLTWPAGAPSAINSCLADEIAGAASSGTVMLNPYGCVSLRIQP
jgi:hypothetical protein